MAKSTKSYEERMLEMEKKEQESLEKAKRYAAQKKELLKRKKAEESKKRTHRLCQIGGAVESVLGAPIEEEDIPKLIGFLKKAGSQWKIFLKGNAERNKYRYGGSVMAEGMSFSFPSLLFHEGRTYGQPEVVPISLPQVATGLRSRLPGSFRRRGFQPDLLMPQEALFARGAHSMQAVMRRALLRRGRSGNAAFSKTESNVAGNLCRMCRKEESRHGDFSLHSQNSRTK